jgi:hypothetical protein
MFAKTSSASIRKAQIRIVHPKPTSGKRCVIMIGKMTPPSADPAATQPRAAPRFFKNQVVTYKILATCKTKNIQRDDLHMRMMGRIASKLPVQNIRLG